MVTALTGCGGASSELDIPASTGTGISVANATAATPLNIAVKPVANPSTVNGK